MYDHKGGRYSPHLKGLGTSTPYLTVPYCIYSSSSTSSIIFILPQRYISAPVFLIYTCLKRAILKSKYAQAILRTRSTTYSCQLSLTETTGPVCGIYALRRMQIRRVMVVGYGFIVGCKAAERAGIVRAVKKPARYKTAEARQYIS